MDTLTERIETLEERLRALRARQNKSAARQRTLASRRERKEDTRRKILLGAWVLARIERGELSRESLQSALDGYLTRPEDRALFALPLRGGSVAEDGSRHSEDGVSEGASLAGARPSANAAAQRPGSSRGVPGSAGSSGGRAASVRDPSPPSDIRS
jgi:hypothetical protein